MDKIIEIQSVGLAKLDNAQHVTFHSRAYDIVNDYEPAKIGIPEPLKVEWKGNLGTEEDISKEVVAETRNGSRRKTPNAIGSLLTSSNSFAPASIRLKRPN